MGSVGGKEAGNGQKRQPSVIEISKKGRQKFRARRYREARELFQSGLQMEPDNPYLLSGMGDACRELGDYAEAERCYRHLLEIEKTNLFALRGLGDVCKKQGRHQESIRHWKQYLTLRPQDKHVMSRIADSCKALQLFDEAEEAYKQIIAFDPRDRFALTGLADLMHRLGEDEKAIAYYEQVLQYDPDELHILTIIGKLCWRINDFDKAERCFRRALAVDPKNTYALYGLGNCFRWHRQYEQAIEIWLEITKISDGTEALFTRMGDAYVHLGENEKAREAYQRAMSLGDDPYAVAGMVCLCCEQQDWSAAQDFFWRLIDTEQDTALRLEQLNKRFVRSGQRDTMLDFFARLLKLGQGNEAVLAQIRQLVTRLETDD